MVKTGWAAAVALGALVLGFLGGGMVGGVAGSAIGGVGGLVGGGCVALNAAVGKGYLTSEQRLAVLDSMLAQLKPDMRADLEKSGIRQKCAALTLDAPAAR
jgi:hypothetical protein